MSNSNPSGRRGLVPARSRCLALLLAAAVLTASASCGGGTDEPAESATGPVVSAPERPHCPGRTIPVPPGADFSGWTLDLTGIPKGQNLRGANFDGAKLTGSIFRDLTGATFRGAHLTNVLFGGDFGGALFDTNFEGAVFDSATGIYAGLDSACFIGASFLKDPAGIGLHIDVPLVGVDFSYSDVLDVLRLDETSVNLARPASKANRFRGVKIPCMYFDKAYLKAMDLTGADLSGCESAFDGKDMSNFAFAGLDLRGFSFEGTNISNATFMGAQLGPSSPNDPTARPFKNAIGVQSADFSGTHFSNFSFGYDSDPGPASGNDLQLRGTKFTGATFNVAVLNSDFTNAVFEKATFNSVAIAGNISGARFTGATFSALNLDGASISPMTDFSYATIQAAVVYRTSSFDGVHFDHAVLSNVDFSGLSLRGTSFAYATFGVGMAFGKGSDGSQAVNAADAHFEHVNAVGTDFSQIVALRAHFDNATLGNTRWNGATLDAASFQGATLTGAIFTGVQARGAFFNSAILIGADFSKTAGLQGANFTNAELSNSTFAGALLDTLTTATPPIVNPAQFTGAHLKNVNFNGARLDGVDFGSASLYGSTQAGSAPSTPCTTDVAMCTATRTGMTCGCASASGASMVGTNFTKAFLYGVDFSNGTFGKTLFNQSILVAADFGGANFISNTGKGGGVSQFRQALLQGVALGDANLTNASLDGAQVDFGVDGTPFGGNDLMVKLDASYTAFAGWAQPNQPVCVLTVYGRGQPSRLPTAAAGMTCPDGLVHTGGCGANSSTNVQWASPVAIDVGPPQAAYVAKPSFGAKGNFESFGCPLSNRSTTW